MAIITRANRPFLDYHRFKAHIDLQDIVSVWNARRRGRAINLIRSYLRSPSVKINAAAKVIRKEIEKAGERDDVSGGLRTPSEAEIEALASTINLFAPQTEPVLYHSKRKSNGGYRYICALPRTLKAAHYIIYDVLSSLLPDNHFYDRRGKGRTELGLEIAAMVNQGFRWFLVGDLADCFQSVCTEELAEILPLPRCVIANCISTSNLTFTYGSSYMEHRETVPQRNGPHRHEAARRNPSGLMQGAPSSNLILMWLLQDIPVPASPGSKMLQWADDLVVGATSEKGCRMAGNTLAHYFSEHGAGPFTLRSGLHHISNGFDFVGLEYCVPRRPLLGTHRTRHRSVLKAFGRSERKRGPKVIIEPSHKCWTKFLEKAITAWDDDFSDGRRRSHRFAKSWRGFAAASPLWLRGPREAKLQIQDGSRHLANFGRSEDPDD